jgi:hypothetical protein
MRKNMGKIKSFMAGVGSKIAIKFFKTYTDSREVSVKCNYKVLDKLLPEIRKNRRLISSTISTEQNKKIRKIMNYPKVASTVSYYSKIWRDAGYFEYSIRPRDYIRMKMGRPTKYHVDKAKCYRLNLTPFYAYIRSNTKCIEFPDGIEFTPEEKRVIKFFFEIPGVRNISNPNIFEGIRDKLVELVVSGYSSEEAGAMDYTGELPEYSNLIKDENVNDFFNFVRKRIDKHKKNILRGFAIKPKNLNFLTHLSRVYLINYAELYTHEFEDKIYFIIPKVYRDLMRFPIVHRK